MNSWLLGYHSLGSLAITLVQIILAVWFGFEWGKYKTENKNTVQDGGEQ